jgi:hypothetical protein
MKLIRLQSESQLNETQFTNNLAISLNLPINSKVALKSLSIEFETPPIVINSTNNIITFSTSAQQPITTVRSITIPSGEYSAQTLLKTIQRLLNAVVQSTSSNSDSGFEWLCNVIDDKSHIAFKRTEVETLTTATANQINVGYTDPQFYKTSGDDDTYSASLVSNKPLNHGSWYLETTLQLKTGQSTTIANSKWIWGIFEVNAQYETGESNLVQLMYAGLARTTNGYYSYKKNYVMVETTIVPTAGDVISISKTLVNATTCKVVYKITQGGTTTTLDGDTITSSTPIVFVGDGSFYELLKIGNDTGKIAFSSLKLTPSGEVINTNGVYTELDIVPNILLNENLTTISPSTVTINLTSTSLRQMLGYNEGIMQKNAISYDFVSNSLISSNIFTDDLVIEIPELMLDGYDHGARQSKNMIMILTTAELLRSVRSIGLNRYELSYNEQATYLFISLKNKQTTVSAPMLSIRCTLNNRTLPLTCNMSALLLFKDEDD